MVEDDDYVSPVVTKWLRGSFLPVTTELSGLQGVGTLSYEVETSDDGYRKYICVTRHAHKKPKILFLPSWSRQGRHSVCFAVVSKT